MGPGRICPSTAQPQPEEWSVGCTSRVSLCFCCFVKEQSTSSGLGNSSKDLKRKGRRCT